MTQPLSLSAQFALLALNERTHNLRGLMPGYAFAGAAFADLASRNRIAPDESRKKRFVRIDSAPTGDAYLDAVLERLDEKAMKRALHVLVMRLGASRSLMRSLFDAMAHAGFVEPVIVKSLGLFNVTRWRLRAVGLRNDLRTRLRNAILQPSSITGDEAVLIALLHHTGLAAHALSHDFAHEHRRTIRAVAKNASAGAGAVGEAITAVTAGMGAAAFIILAG